MDLVDEDYVAVCGWIDGKSWEQRPGKLGD